MAAVPPNSVIVIIDVVVVLLAVQAKSVAVPFTSNSGGSLMGTSAVAIQPLPEVTCTV